MYIGVSDNGRVMGITYTCEEADHLRKSISNALSRFSPPVESNLWEVCHYVCVCVCACVCVCVCPSLSSYF